MPLLLTVFLSILNVYSLGASEREKECSDSDSVRYCRRKYLLVSLDMSVFIGDDTNHDSRIFSFRAMWQINGRSAVDIIR